MPDVRAQGAHVRGGAAAALACAKEGGSEMSDRMEYEVVGPRKGESEWRVEAIDYENDGEVYLAIFSGPGAEKRAKEYARLKRSLQAAWDSRL